ncbi:hypothetical protein GCM10027440_08300 [Nocardiopsis coralliicola]
MTDVPSQVAGFVDDAVCEATSSAGNEDDCAESEGDQEGSPQAGGPDDGSGGHGALPGGTGGGGPELSEDDIDAGRSAADDIREYWDENTGWFGCVFMCPDEPKEVLEDLTDSELEALFHSLTEDEIRRLLDEDGVREIALSRLSLDTLRMLRKIDPDGIEPDFNDVGGDGANEDSGKADGLSWGRTDESQVDLWPDDGEISMSDINQGSLGDCWWLAGIGAVAEKHPEVVRDMIKENGNGTYTVTFPDTGEQVTVTPDMVMENGAPAFAKPTDGVMWPLILEKAYAEREGSFGEIEGGWPKDAMHTVTGEDSKSYGPDDVDQQDLAGWLDGNKTAVTITTPPEGDDNGPLYDKDPNAGGLANNHAYIVQGMDSDGNVTLYNPWGRSHATLTQEEFQEHIQSVEINSYG